MATPKAKKPKTPRRVADSEDEPSDGNDPPFNRIESEPRMSKEKQKFFRFSAFNLVKGRRRRESSSPRGVWGGVSVARYEELELRMRRTPSPSPTPTTTSSSSSSTSSRTSSPSPTPSRSPSVRSSSAGSCREDAPRQRSPPAPPPRAPLPCVPPAPTQVSSVFEKLGSKSSPGDTWGFAAEARKTTEQSPATSPDPPRPVPPARRQVRARSTVRRSRCGERLLSTLFDGLSEFYTVRNSSRSQSRPRVREQPPPWPAREERCAARKEVLKETRSTFRQYQESLVSRQQAVCDRDRQMVPSKDRRSPSPDKDEIRWTYSYNKYDRFRTPSQLVRCAAANKHHRPRDELAKLRAGLEKSSLEPDLEFLRESLSFDFADRRRLKSPASNQSGKAGRGTRVCVSGSRRRKCCRRPALVDGWRSRRALSCFSFQILCSGSIAFLLYCRCLAELSAGNNLTFVIRVWANPHTFACASHVGA